MTPEMIRAQNEEVQRAYQLTFGTPHGRRVLTDLAAYCHARKPTFEADARAHAFKEGQRDVFLRIQEFMSLTIEEIYQLRGSGRTIAQKEDTDGHS